MNNRWMFVGNDERFRICQQLAEVEGKEVCSIAETLYVDRLEEAITQFQPGHLVLPIQPLKVLPNPTIIPKQTRIYVGGGKEVLDAHFQQLLTSYLQDEQFLVDNAKLTAEAWVHHFYEKDYGSLYGKKFLIAGYGRVGRALAARIHANEGKVYVLSAEARERTSAEAAGYEAKSLSIEIDLSDMYLINTIPAQWYRPKKTDPLRLFDLASFPHCLKDVNHFEYDTVLPTLPGKYFPIDAAKLLYRTLQRLA